VEQLADRAAVATDELLDRAAVQVRVREACAALEPRQQRILDVVYGDGRQLKDAAAELGMSYANVRRYHRRALRRVGALLRATHRGEPRVAPGVPG